MPFRKVDVARFQVDPRYATLIMMRLRRGVMVNAICTVLFALLAGVFIYVFEHRVGVVDGREKQLACIALKYTPPTTDFAVELRRSYPECPAYKPSAP